ncbi:hypothetical protein V6N13_094587 [Hibiscus sabdariffa]|uniref:Uncharacterized protein n=1 Tax=Hibiscus sabdariffa TaxID=183260 RepID=A0ABR2PPD1_9ROSI
MLVSTVHSSSFSRFNIHYAYSLKQPNLISKALAFPQFMTFCVKKPNSNSELSASNDIPVVSPVSGPIHTSQAIDAGSSMRKPISLWPGMYHSPVMNTLWKARSSMFEKNSDETQDSQTELVAKTPSMSRTSIAYKFSSDHILREQYKNPWDEMRMRMEKLLEDEESLV